MVELGLDYHFMSGQWNNWSVNLFVQEEQPPEVQGNFYNNTLNLINRKIIICYTISTRYVKLKLEHKLK